MSNAAWIFGGVVWLSFVGFLVALMFLRRPVPKKPCDALEAADAALKSRIIDLEDKFESYVKREAVRGMRARREEGAPAALPLESDRAAQLKALRGKAADLLKHRGGLHGIAR